MLNPAAALRRRSPSWPQPVRATITMLPPHGWLADAARRLRGRPCPACRCRAAPRRAGNRRPRAALARPRRRCATSWPDEPRAAPAPVGRVHVVVGDQHAARRAGALDLRAARLRRDDAFVGATGRRTVNSLPRPGPVARRLDAPPCSSTRRLHQRQADAEPALARDRAPVRLREQLEDARQHVGGDADAVVAHADVTASPPGAHARRRSRPPGLLYLAALLSRLANTWASRAGSASSQHRLVGAAQHQLVAAAARRAAWRSPPPPGARRRPQRATAAASSVLRDSREMSSRSSSSRAMCAVCRSMISPNGDASGRRVGRAGCAATCGSARAGCAARGRASR